MTVVTTYTVICNSCGTRVQGNRDAARAIGWAYTAATSTDRCPACRHPGGHPQEPCPTEAAYKRHKARGEDCAFCNAYMRVVWRERHAKKIKEGTTK